MDPSIDVTVASELYAFTIASILPIILVDFLCSFYFPQVPVNNPAITREKMGGIVWLVIFIFGYGIYHILSNPGLPIFNIGKGLDARALLEIRKESTQSDFSAYRLIIYQLGTLAIGWLFYIFNKRVIGFWHFFITGTILLSFQILYLHKIQVLLSILFCIVIY